MSVRLVDDVDEWDALRDQWEELYAAVPSASAPLDFAWLRFWWRIYGPLQGNGGLRIVTVWRRARLIGVLPLFEDRSGPFGSAYLRFLSTGEAEHEETCPDYLDLLCLPGEEAACGEAVAGCVERLDWSFLELLDLPESSPLVRRLPPRARVFVRGRCPVADLTSGLDAYLARLSSNTRGQVRRLLREGERAGAAFEIVSAERAAGAFEDLVRLHQARWNARGKPGVFASPRFTAFHRALVGVWLPSGKAVLARLSVAGEPAAVLYGFVTGTRFEFYQSGVSAGGAALRSPGTLAHLLLMRHLAARGVTAYDFLRGASSYKERLATRHNTLVAVQAWRPTVRAAVCRSAGLIARVARRARLVRASRWTAR